jgi:hypothetical protein
MKLVYLSLSRLHVTALERHFQISGNKGGESLTYLDPSKPRIGEVCTDAYSGVSLFAKQGSGPGASATALPIWSAAKVDLAATPHFVPGTP